MKEKNIYQKIQEIRLQLSKKSIKKSGKNSFQNYEYFELGDFLNPLNELMNTNGVMSQFLLQDNRAVLHIINSDKPDEKVTFYTPTAIAEGKGTNAIQQLGSQITYLRRYLFLIAFEIAENDTVDNRDAKTFNNASVNHSNASVEHPSAVNDRLPYQEDNVSQNANDDLGLKEPTTLICMDCDKGISQKVFDFSTKKYDRSLCMSCQAKA